MTYRNPRFSYIHTLREEGEANGFDGSSSTFDADAPQTRLMDDQSNLLARSTSDSSRQISLQRTSWVAHGHGRLGRIIIPAGHNLGHARQLVVTTQIEAGGSPSWPPFPDGSVIEAFIPSSGIIDLEYSQTDLAGYADEIQMYFSAITGGVLSLGEFWWTNIVQPTTGVEPGWDDSREPVHHRATTRSGATFTSVLGDPRRHLTLSHRAISGADLALYDNLFSRVGYGSHSFWVDPPDSGDKEVTINALTSTADLGTTNCTIDTASGGAPDGSADCIEVTQTGAGVCSTRVNGTGWEMASPVDCRGKVLQLDFEIDTSAAWLTSADDFEIIAEDTAAHTRWSVYEIGNALLTLPEADKWHRVQVDLGSDLASDQTKPADLSTISRFVLNFTAAAAQVVRFANLRLIDKSKQPVLVELEGYRRRQSSIAPTAPAGPLFDVELDLIEVTA